MVELTSVPVAPPVNTVANREEDSMNNEPTMSGKSIIGLIYPPPDIRAVIEKTAGYVAKNGIDFENKIREKEAANPRWNFLNNTDPYNAYYNLKVREYRDGKTDVAPAKASLPEAVKEHVKKVEFIPQKPPPTFEFSADPATINAYELDLIRTTALFVARNGRQFLTQVMTREARNYQFDFLKPAHSNFQYFTKLVEQYTKVIIPPTHILQQLSLEKDNNSRLMEDINYRVAWERHQRSIKDKQDKELEKERQAYASIDWHDFVVVQTVDFQPNDMSNLPGLCTPADVGARILLEQRNELQKAAGQAVEMDVGDSDSDDEREIRNEVDEAKQPDFAQPFPPTRNTDLVVRDYDPKKAVQQRQQKPSDKWLISPLTGERIPSDKLDEHVRYNTVDSQYKEDRDRLMGERGVEEPVLAPGAEISKNLGRFAERRTDIFGGGAEQAIIGRKLGEDGSSLMPNKPLWDGTEETREMHTTRIQNQVTLEQQISEIHRQHGFTADPSKEKIGAQPLQPPIPVLRAPVRPASSLPPSTSDGPPTAKKARTEEELEPAEIWLTKVSGPIDLRVQLPLAPEMSLDGSIVSLQIDCSVTVADLKQRIQDKFNMPITKQKLLYENFFLKDNVQLAYYNMTNMSFVIVQVKERGGKNKNA